MQPTSSSQLLPLITLSAKARALIEMIYARQWQPKYKPQVHLVHELTAGSIAEHALKMDQYRLTADDYQRAAQDPIVLQAWLENLPPHIRDVQVTRFINEMCFTNKIQILQLLTLWGFDKRKLDPAFLSFLKKRATRAHYDELAAYLA